MVYFGLWSHQPNLSAESDKGLLALNNGSLNSYFYLRATWATWSEVRKSTCKLVITSRGEVKTPFYLAHIFE